MELYAAAAALVILALYHCTPFDLKLRLRFS